MKDSQSLGGFIHLHDHRSGKRLKNFWQLRKRGELELGVRKITRSEKRRFVFQQRNTRSVSLLMSSQFG